MKDKQIDYGNRSKSELSTRKIAVITGVIFIIATVRSLVASRSHLF